jgi:hypothetical protein
MSDKSSMGSVTGSRPVLSKPPPLPVHSEDDDDTKAESLGLPLQIRDSLVLLLLTLAADFCLYREWGPTGGSVLMIFTMALLWFLKGNVVPAKTWSLCAVISGLALVLAWNAWWLAVVMSVLATTLLAVSIWRPELNLLELFWAGGLTFLHAAHRLTGHWVSCRAYSKNPDRKEFPAQVIFVPIAVTLLFLVVFSSANPVISRELSKLGDYFSDFGTLMRACFNIGRTIFWLAGLLVFAALIRPVIKSEFIHDLLSMDSRLKSCATERGDDVNCRVAFSTLVCVNLLFLGYNCLDAVYLYFKASLPAGITWTAYTHAGCGWLTFGLFLSSLTLGFIFWNELNFHPRSKVLKQLAFIWIAQNAVLAVGTLRRIYMYVDYSGLTHLLLTGVYGSVLVLAGLVIMALKVHGNRSAIWLLRRYVAAFAAGLLILALTPHGWVCASFNVPRVLQDKPHAAWPIVLKKLPADALPALIPLMDYQSHDGNTAREKLVREGIAGLLGKELARLEIEQSRSWQHWQGSSVWALDQLRQVRVKINETAPSWFWEEALCRLKTDYDLSGSTR